MSLFKPKLSFNSVLDNNEFFGSSAIFSAATLKEGMPAELDYGDKVAFASMAPYLYKDTSILEVGCGSRSAFVKALLDVGCHYTGFDIEENALFQKALDLQVLGDFDVNLIEGDALTDLGQFADSSFDVVLVQSMLLHVPADQRNGLLKELRRISNKALFIVENSWSRMGNYSHNREFDRLKSASAKLLASHGKTPDMDTKLPSVVISAFSGLPSEVFRIDDRQEDDYSKELMSVCKAAMSCLDNCYHEWDASHLSSSIDNMVEYLESPNVAFIPPALVVAHIPKLQA